MNLRPPGPQPSAREAERYGCVPLVPLVPALVASRRIGSHGRYRGGTTTSAQHEPRPADAVTRQADGLVLKNGVPRNPLQAALVLQMGEIRLPGGYAALDRVLRLLALVARWRGVDRELERRYL